MTQKEINAQNCPCFGKMFPQFYELVADFPDFQLQPGLQEDDIARLEKNLEFALPSDMRQLLRCAAGISMNGLRILADRFSVINLPDSEALLIGEFYLRNAGDRLFILPHDGSVYYLEHQNGAVTKLASSLGEFFNHFLPRQL